MHRWVVSLVALGLAATLAGCSGDGGDSATTEEPASLDAALLECGDPDDAGGMAQLPDVDIEAATWLPPEGFTETFEYSEDRPVEHIERIWVAEPTKDPAPRNVLTVVIYSQLDWGDAVDECGRVATDVVDMRLEGYNDHTGAEPLSEVEAAEIAGLPALEQELRLPEYSYRGYWVFSRSQLMHVYCQWTDTAERTRILTACHQLVDSVEVPGA